MEAQPRLFKALALILAFVAASTTARAEDGPSAPAVAATAPATPDPKSAEGADQNASQYCRNIVNAAADARYVRQAEALAAMEKELEDRITKLEAKRAEYEEWVKRRQELLEKADGSVVAIYSQMRPDAAANQFAVMDPEAAAAILSKLNPRIASAILNEMDATTAAALTNVMAGLPTEIKTAGGQG
ncbi:MAG: MotE family protein [Bauldia sp.]|nr:MotE family protein [Bauldia sp.]